MATIIAREFSFSKDFRKIKWGPTIGYNLLRAACAGLVLDVLMLIFPQSQNDQTVAFFAPLIWAGGYFIFFLPFGLVLSFLSGFVPFAGIFAFFLALIAVTLGDPIVCLLKAVFSKLVPVDSPPLFSLNLIMFVVDAPEVAIASGELIPSSQMEDNDG